MRKSITIQLIFLLLCSASAFANFQAGIAIRVVTPDPLLPVSGGIGPSNPVKEKKGDLTVRAMVFEDDDTRIAIVSADFLGFPAVLGDRVRKQVSNIPPENIMIGATHTHSAPDCYGFPDGEGGFSSDLKYLDLVCEKMAEAINEAVENLQPAYLKITTGEAQGKIAYNYYAPQLYDPRCHIIQALDQDEKPFATLVNYAVHPEVIGNRREILSPDLVGPLYDRLAEKGAGVGIFMNGAQGGMVTADNRAEPGEERNTWEECIRIGNLLADETVRFLETAPVQKEPTLDCFATNITFSMDSPLLRKIVQLSPLQYPLTEDGTVTTQVNLVNIGNAQILTIPGEALPNIGYYLKRKMHGEHNFLFGLTNDAFGYILTKVDFNSFKRYEYVSRTSLGEMTGEIFIEEALKFADQSPKPQKLGKE